MNTEYKPALAALSGVNVPRRFKKSKGVSLLQSCNFTRTARLNMDDMNLSNNDVGFIDYLSNLSN